MMLSTPAIPTKRILTRTRDGLPGRCIMFEKLQGHVIATLSSSYTGKLSTKRAAFGISVVTLSISCLGVSGAVTYQIVKSGDIGAGAAGALLTVCGAVSALAGVGYRKADVGVAAPPAGNYGARTCVENSPNAESVVPGAKFEGTE